MNIRSKIHLVAIAATLLAAASLTGIARAEPAPYPDMPEFAPPMVRTAKYLTVPESARGPAIDATLGYRVEALGHGAYLLTEGVYQMMLLVHDQGVVLVDAPPSIGAKIFQALDQVAPGKRVTHLVYSHAHIDHIGFAGEVQKRFPAVKIVAHAATASLLARAKDPQRPLPTTTFDGVRKPYTLAAGGRSLRLEYPGPNHEPGNIEVWHAESRTLMLVDVVFPGWMMWRRFALAQDIPGDFELVRTLNDRYDFTTLISGHLNRTGTKADVTTQYDFMRDLHAAAYAGLTSTKLGEGMDPADTTNAWAVFDNYIDRVTIKCVNAVTPKWQDRLAAFDVFIFDQCMSMEQSLRVDGPSL